MAVAVYTDIVAADVIAICPKAAQIDQTFLQVIVDFANETTPDGLGCAADDARLRLARLYLAAHLALTTRNARTGAAGPVTSEAAGGLRRSFGLMMSSTGIAGLASTQFGAQYLTILSMSVPAHGPILV